MLQSPFLVLMLEILISILFSVQYGTPIELLELQHQLMNKRSKKLISSPPPPQLQLQHKTLL